MPPCIEDCAKVLSTVEKPQVRIERVIVIREVKEPQKNIIKGEVEFKNCIQMDEDAPCVPADPRTGFYSVITSEDSDGSR